MALEHAAEHQAGGRDRGVERVADQVAQIVGLEPVRACDPDRMNEHEGLELRRCRPQRFERWVVEVLAAAVRSDHRALEAELAHRAPQLRGGLFRRLHRQRRDAHEAVRAVLHMPGDLFVLDRGDRDRHGWILIRIVGLRGCGQHVHIDPGRVHVLEPSLDIPAAARERAIRNADDFELAVVLVIRGESRSELRRLLGEEPHGLVGEDVRMGVDGA